MSDPKQIPPLRLRRTDADREHRARAPLRTLDEIDGKGGKLRTVRHEQWRARSGMLLAWTCARCELTREEWQQAISPDVPQHEARALFHCEPCDLPQMGLISQAWRQRAQDRRPYELWKVGLWDYERDGRRPPRPEDTKPPPIRCRALEREMTMQLIHLCLTDRPGDDVVGLLARPYDVPSPEWGPTASEPAGDLVIPFPESRELQALLLDLLPAVAAEHAEDAYEVGHPIEVKGARKGLNAGQWWYAERQVLSASQRALAERIEAEVRAAAAQPRTPEPSADLTGVPNPHAPVLYSAEGTPPPALDPVIEAYQTGEDLPEEAAAEWEADNETHPGLTVEAALWPEEE